MISVLKIMPNGVPATVQNAPVLFGEIAVALSLSVTVFLVLSLLTAKGFEKEAE